MYGHVITKFSGMGRFTKLWGSALVELCYYQNILGSVWQNYVVYIMIAQMMLLFCGSWVSIQSDWKASSHTFSITVYFRESSQHLQKLELLEHIRKHIQVCLD